MIEANERFPDWHTIYNEQSIETMGWFWPELDPDLKSALKERNLGSGSFLDLGTGPGTQSAGLTELGFQVTATDISHEAIRLAKDKFGNIDFIQDDILNSKLDMEFDYIFDRGCFHIFNETQQMAYLRSILKLLVNNGILFLKCFSHKNGDIGKGPYQFSPEMINKIFGRHFEIESISESIYQGPRDPNPIALFIVLKKLGSNSSS